MSVTNDLLERDPLLAFHILEDYAAFRDDKPAYFGNDGDAWIKYNSTDDVLEIGGKAARFSGGLFRKVTAKAVDATIAASEALYGQIQVTVTGKTMTLPVAGSNFRGADVIISPKGAFATTVTLASGTFGNDTVTSTLSVAPGTSAHLICDGTVWYQEGGGGGGGAATTYSDYIEIADPAAPAANTLRLFASNGESGPSILSAKFSDSTVRTFAFEREIDAARYPGADASVKINAAIADSADGQTVDARALSGACTQTINVNKKIHLKLGNTLSWLAAGAITECIKVSATVADGADVEGEGPGVTVLIPKNGTIGIKVQAYDSIVHHLGIAFNTPTAGNIGVYLKEDAGVGNLLRPHLDDLDINGAGYRTLGAANLGNGIQESIVFVASITRCYIHGFLNGRFMEDKGFNSTTTTFTEFNRIYDNCTGVYCDGGSYWGHHNVIEGNAHFGLYVSGTGSTFTINSDHEYYENPLDENNVSGAPTNIHIEGLAINPFGRNYSIKRATFSNPPGTGYDVYIGPGTEQHLFMTDSPYQQGIYIGTGQPIPMLTNSMSLGAVNNVGHQSEMLSTSYSVFWRGHEDAVLTVDGWTGVFFNHEFDETGPVTKSYVQFANTAQTTGNYAGTFQGTVLSMTINPEQSDDLTGLASAATVALNLYGSGELTTMWAQFNQVSQDYVGATWSAVTTYTVGNYVTYGSPKHTYKSKTVGNLNHAPPNATYWEDLGEASHVIGAAAFVARVVNHTEATWDQGIAMFIYPAVNDGGGTIANYTALAIADTPDRTGITEYFALRTFGGTVQSIIGGHAGEYFWVFTSVDPSAFKVDGTTGTIGMGAPPDPAIKVFVNSSWTDAGTVDVGLVNNTQYAPTATRTVASFGLSMTTFVASGNTHDFSAVFEGAYQSTEHRGTGLMADVRGEVISVANSSTGTMTLARALQLGIVNGAGATIGTSWNLLLDPPSNSGTWATHYGEQITMPTSGTFTNLAGLYITTPAGVTCAYPYAILVNGGHVHFNSAGGAYDFLISTDTKPAAFSIVGSTDSLSIDTTLLGFYGAAPTAKGSTFTQTYATTATTLIDGSNDLVNGTGVAAVDQTMEDVTTAGLADPVKVNRNFAELVVEFNLLRASELSSKQVLNALLDYLQLRGDIG